MSARQIDILYFFDVLTVEESTLHCWILEKNVLRVETEDLLRMCAELLPRLPEWLPECEIPIPADMWEGLGIIRDGVVSLMEKVLGPDHGFIRRLQLESLEGEEKRYIIRSFNMISKVTPGFLSSLANEAISLIKMSISDPSSIGWF